MASLIVCCSLSSSINYSFNFISNKTVAFPTITNFQFKSKSLSHPLPLLQVSHFPISASMATGWKEILPPPLTSTSDPPSIFDGTTRQGLQDQIELVPIDLQDRPAWYKDKVYPPNKVPALEHKNEVKGESLDLIKYIDSNFGGPSLFPDDPAKKELAEELFSHLDSFNKALRSLFKGDANEAASALDFIETSLSKFNGGPFFLGQFSLVDIAYAPFIERYLPALLDIREYDITAGRPNLAAWIQEMNQNEAYNQTRRDPKEHVESFKRRLLAQK